jgi:hypothetical protein
LGALAKFNFSYPCHSERSEESNVSSRLRSFTSFRMTIKPFCKRLLGLNKKSNEQEIIMEVKKLVMDLRGKMGFSNAGIMNMIKRLSLYNHYNLRNLYKAN